MKSDRHRQARAGDGSSARPSIRLQHIAVNNHGALTQCLHVDHRTQRAADQPLNLVGTPANFAPLRFARRRAEAAQRADAIRIERGAVTERTVEAAARAGERLVLGRGAVLTPLARDRARSGGVEIEREC